MCNTNIQLAALYCRLSKSHERDDESLSISNQKALLTKEAKRRGYEHYRFFIDDGYSGSLFKRPAFLKMIEAIESGVVCAVIVKDTSRFGRDHLKIGQYIETLFPDNKVRFIAVAGGIDSNTSSIDYLPFISVMDEWYSRDISRKMRSMYESRALKGEPFGIPVYGYKKSENDIVYWEPNPETAPVVRKIYQMALLGYGAAQIAAVLENDKVLTPTHYSLSKGGNCGRRKKNSNPYAWAISTVSQILARQEYCGDIVNQKTYSHSFKDIARQKTSQNDLLILKDRHEPIIERRLWERVQILKTNKKIRKRKEPSLFSGLLRCGDCGANMHYHFNQKNPDIKYYNCSNYIGNRGTCKNTHYVRLDYLEKLVEQEVSHLLCIAQNNKIAFTQKVEKLALQNAKIIQHDRLVELKSLEQRKVELLGWITKLYEDKSNGDLDDDLFVLLAGSYKKDHANTIQEIQNIKDKIFSIQQKEYDVCRFLNVIEEAAAMENILNQELLYQIIEYVAVYPANRTQNEATQRVEIFYHHIGQMKEIL